jgi:intracellular septation protein A
MKSIHKLLSNPILIIVVFAGVYYSTGDFFYLTGAIMALVTLQVIFEKIVEKKVGKVLFFFLVVIAAPRIFDLVLKRSTILAMEIFYRSLAYGAYFNFNLLL